MLLNNSPYNAKSASVRIVKIPCHLKDMTFSTKCTSFCSHGKRVQLFSSMKFYLIAMICYEQTIPGKEMRTVITLELVLWLLRLSMAYNFK